MHVEVTGADLKRVVQVLRDEAPDAVPIMRAHLREVAAPMVTAARAGAETIRFETVTVERVGLRKRERVTTAARSSAATSARKRAGAKYTRSMAEAAATGKRLVSKKVWETQVAKHRLRAGIARGIRAQQSQTKREATLTVRTWQAPAFVTSRSSQRAARNKGEWRHPVFAKPGTDRKSWTWVTQRVANPDWWDRALESQSDAAREAMADALAEWVTLADALVRRAAN